MDFGSIASILDDSVNIVASVSVLVNGHLRDQSPNLELKLVLFVFASHK